MKTAPKAHAGWGWNEFKVDATASIAGSGELCHPFAVATIRICLLILLVWGCHSSVRSQTAATGTHGAVATVHPLATAAALQAIRAGGNAVDAAVAAGLTLGVVDGHNSGIGGGCFMLIRRPDGAIVALDGREMAPAAASPQMFLRRGRADTKLSQTGSLAPGVPGSLAVYELAQRRYGRLPLATVLLPAADLAEQGFLINDAYSARLRETARDLRRFPSTRAIFLNRSAQPWPAGHRLRQPDLARSYRALAASGLSWFYDGAFAEKTETWMRSHHGLLTAADFRRYRVVEREPLRTTYRGYELIGFPPPSSGGIHVAQILNLIEPFELSSWGPHHAHSAHTLAEAMKLAFADRAFWLGDADFVPVPRGLLEKSYATRLRTGISLERATLVPHHGEPPRAREDLFRRHTTHFSVADAEGNWVACTTTLNTSFGSKVVVPGTGIVLNNQMDDFSIQPGVTNYFGLVGSDANAVAPGKRPLSSMSPTLVLQDGKPILCIGAAGGPTIISQVVLLLVGVLDFHLDLPSAQALPRLHHQWQPDELRVEKSMPQGLREELRRRGHPLKVVNSLGAAQGVSWSPTQKVFTGAADPRGNGQAVAW